MRDDEGVPESWASSTAVRNVMRANRGRDTAPELALRRALHAAGLRYRLNTRPITGSRMTVDIVFPRARVAVEVLGCFWHGCPDHHRPAIRNSEFWTTKIRGNVERDARKRTLLEVDGWELLTVWEHDDPAEAVKQIVQLVSRRRAR
ncbi:very short patch repair endonuclease [Mycobacteroides chelonae]|uniref:very short patch repair endonuclease n=1 Tax=Mycobacteroides chelonae TaxID=1774 RepID=UPI001C6CC5AC|nr:very short patch repair endonuclease [Mycobacteroides chelonae]MBV6362750.1 very short patch repair endonuclease [Mycobacteroides chelonae]